MSRYVSYLCDRCGNVAQAKEGVKNPAYMQVTVYSIATGDKMVYDLCPNCAARTIQTLQNEPVVAYQNDESIGHPAESYEQHDVLRRTEDRENAPSRVVSTPTIHIGADIRSTDLSAESYYGKYAGPGV